VRFAWERKNMNIKKLVPVGILAVIIAGGIGAYMFLYPQEVKVSHAVVAPKAPPRVAAPAAAALVAAPVSAPVAAPAAQPPAAAPKAAVAPAKVIAPVAAPVVAETVQALQPPLKLSKSLKSAKAKTERPKNLDLRNCLDLEEDKAIAKCAGE
jgi:hypothetical protein